MEIETETNNNLEPNIAPNLGNKINNNFYSSENIAYSAFNNFKFFFQNINHQNPFKSKKYRRKRNYIESLSNSERIEINQKEIKYLLNFMNQIKLKLDKENNYLSFSQFIKKKEQEKEKNKEKDNIKDNIPIDYSIIDLNDIILQLYQSDKISNELKNFLLKKMINNAIQVEKTFNNFFNINNFPNKK